MGLKSPKTSVKHLLQEAQEQLRTAGVSSNAGLRQEARRLLAAVLKTSVEKLLAYPELEVTPVQGQAFHRLIHRRVAHEPLSRILGRREFWSLNFQISPGTLDPRPESETLIQVAIDLFPHKETPLKVLDFGTGSGCLLLSLLHEFPQAQGIGVDQSEDALGIARQNSVNLGMENRAHFLKSNWGEGLRKEEKVNTIKGFFDLIISNPPYIPGGDIEALPLEVKAYDPRLALDGGESGLAAYEALAVQIPEFLKPRGYVVLEIGQGQGPAVQHLFERAGLVSHGWSKDLSGIDRCGVFSVPQPF